MENVVHTFADFIQEQKKQKYLITDNLITFMNASYHIAYYETIIKLRIPDTINTLEKNKGKDFK